jgi:hypothetical protein
MAFSDVILPLNPHGDGFAMKTWIIAGALGIALSSAAVSGAFAQAGSTGGTIGKTDKSVSGTGEETPPSRDKIKTPGQGNSAAILTGSWNWRAQCGPLTPGGVFVISNASGGRISGDFLSDVTGTFSGTISGDRISFARILPSVDSPQRWTGTISWSSGRMAGEITRPLGVCTWSATK